MAPLPRLQQAAKEDDKSHHFSKTNKEISTKIYGPQRSTLDLMLAAGGGSGSASTAAPTSAQAAAGPGSVGMAGGGGDRLGFVGQMRAQRQPAEAQAKREAAAAAAHDAAVAVSDLSAADVATIQAGYQHNISLPHTGVGYKRGGAGGGEEEADGSNSNDNSTLPAPVTKATNQRARQLMVAGGAFGRDPSGKDSKNGTNGKNSNVVPQYRKSYQDDSSDEDVGRSGLGRKKARKGWR